MKQKCFFLIAAFLLLGVSAGFAETICSFDGSWDIDKKEVKLVLKPVQGGQILFDGRETSPSIIDFHVEVRQLKFLLFDFTTEMNGTAKVKEVPGSYPAIEGIVGKAGGQPREDDSAHFVQGAFEIRDNKIFFKNCTWAGLGVQGYWSLILPYEMDVSLKAQDVLLADLFSWLGQEEVYPSGKVSGKIHLSGIADCLAVKGRFSSSGQIGDFRYDSLVVNIEGFYPVVKLSEASMTQEDGVSFMLEGSIDLSKDFKKFPEQLAKLKTLPLIRQTDVDREWTIRRRSEDKKKGETEFKYRLRKEREISGVEEGGMLTIQQSIKF